jgi:release factor glutamine methyltransferase
MRLLRLPGVFEPHSDSWLLADQLVQEQLLPSSRVLDLCTGSGVLAVIAATRHGSEVTAIDVSRRAVLTARLNAKLNGVSVTAMRGDLFEPAAGQRFDLIVSNPPYLPTPDEQIPNRGAARAWEAGPSGRAYIDRICAMVSDHLRPRGTLLLVHSSVCGEQETLRALAERGLHAQVVVRKPGPLGRRLRGRAGWLKDRGLLENNGGEEILVIRAQRAD